MDENHKYSFRIQWSDEDEEYVATRPEFPDLSAFGGTPASALNEALVALDLFIETYQEDGLTLPEARMLRPVEGSGCVSR